MPAGQNHSNFALNTRLSAPRYDTWCKIQVSTQLREGMNRRGKGRVGKVSEEISDMNGYAGRILGVIDR
jgi:hypothetical protein